VDYPKNVSDTLLDEMESVARKIRKKARRL
jgi:hypothetical protein